MYTEELEGSNIKLKKKTLEFFYDFKLIMNFKVTLQKKSFKNQGSYLILLLLEDNVPSNKISLKTKLENQFTILSKK
jgi:hypothetical protein